MSWTRRSLSQLLLVVIALTVTACMQMPTVPGPRPGPAPRPAAVGEVRVDAPGVLFNNRAVTGVVPLFIGDHVRTDATGRATIRFNVGGELVLGPNTDPLLQLVSEAGCLGEQLVVYIRTGTFDFFNVSAVCFCDTANAVCGAPESDFRVVITNAGASITVSRGALRVTVGHPPQQRQYLVTQGQGMHVQQGKTSGPQRIVR
jgi:hypothetical protein